MFYSCYNKLLNNEIINKDDILQYMLDHELIKKEIDCIKCKKTMKIISFAKSDGFLYFCKYCNNRASIRSKTLFYKSKVSIKILLVILANFCVDTPAKNLIDKFLLSKQCVLKWYGIFRSILSNYLNSNFVQLGGEGIKVEIDETLLARRKYNRGRMVDQQWLFGVIERESSNIFLKCVDERSKRTLGKIIKKVIAKK